MAGETSHLLASAVGKWFQSAPAIDGGRNDPTSAADPGAAVSIRSRHRWREKRSGDSVLLRRLCFNPLPPSMAGETLDRVPSPLDHRVSIRSRHRWREKHIEWIAVYFIGVVSIRSRHRWREKPRRLPLERGLSCFNPLPPSMAGETPAPAVQNLVVSVSIRSRHRWREKPSTDPSTDAFMVFQSAPAIDGGRNRRPICWRRSPPCFNPLPPSMAGETCRSPDRR